MSETKGITVKVPIELHTEVSAHLAATKKTMNAFVAEALKNELHPKNQIMEDKGMEKKKTIAFQVSEDLRERWDAYLMRNKKTLVAVMTGLMEKELEREQAEIEENSQGDEAVEEEDEEEEESENLGDCDGEENEGEEEDETEDEELETEEEIEETEGGPVMNGM